ncbi:hypothetical protein [Fodinibius sp. AD559]|uniref:hypothetical protein n=1 Tax=Fodinibius sp. AD559 TaxID=3424179 RepID=UPI0040470185
MAKLLRGNGITKYEKKLESGPSPSVEQRTLEYKYDPKSEHLYHKFMVENNRHETEEVEVSESLDQRLKRKLKRELRRDKKTIANEILSRDSDAPLKVYLNHIEEQINILIKCYRKHEEVKSRPYIKQHLIDLISHVGEKAPEEFAPTFEKLEENIDGRGNPNFKKQEMGQELLISLVEKANQLLEEEYEHYKGQNEDTFLSSSLGLHLQDEFDIAESTIRDNFQKKCKKVGGLFRVKDAYK